MKAAKAGYWIVSGLLFALMLFAAFNYIFRHDLIIDVFNRLGYPTYLIYPLATAKVLGVIAIITGRSPTLKQWAYAGFFFNFVLAASAHINANDGVQVVPALVCLLLLIVSYILDRKIHRPEASK